MNEEMVKKIKEARECAYYGLSYWKQSCFHCDLFSIICNALAEAQQPTNPEEVPDH